LPSTLTEAQNDLIIFGLGHGTAQFNRSISQDAASRQKY